MKNILIVLFFVISSTPAMAENEYSQCKAQMESERVVNGVTDDPFYMKNCLELRGKGSDVGLFFSSTDSLNFTHVRHAEPTRFVRKKTCEMKTDCPPAKNPLITEYADFLFSFSNFFRKTKDNGRSAADCDCIKQNFQSDLGSTYQDELKKEREKLNQKILKAYSKKFLNDFSSNLEDASFFLTKNRDVFSNQKTAKDIQCNDPETFNKKINEVCQKKGITDREFIGRRKDFFINSLDGGKTSFELRLTEMAEEIQSLPYLEGFEASLYTRYEYDNSRIGTAHTDPLGKLAEHIMKKVILAPDSDEKLRPYLAESNPIQAIVVFLEENKNRPGFLKDMGFDEKIIKETFKDPERLKGAFRFLLNTHPGFLNAMEDKTTFKKLAAEVKKSPDSSILDILETKPHVLEPLLHKKCEQLIEDFAKAVCTSDQDLISSADPEDLENLQKATTFHSNPDPKKRELYEVLLCEKKSSEADLTDLANLFDPKLPSRKSDYLERLMEKDLEKHKNRFTQSMFANAENGSFKDAMKIAAVTGQSIAKSVEPGGVVATDVYAKAVSEGKAFSFGEPAMTKAQALAYLKESHEYKVSKEQTRLAETGYLSQKSKTEEETQIQPQMAKDPETFLAPVSQSTFVNPTPSIPQISPAKDQLNDYLVRNNNPEDVSKVLNGLDDKNIDELNSLRSENSALLKDAIQQESKRMTEMQTKISDLESKLKEDVMKGQTSKVADHTSPEKFREEKTAKESSLPERLSAGKVQHVRETSADLNNSKVPLSAVQKGVSFEARQVGRDEPQERATEGLTVIPGEASKTEMADKEANQEIRNFLSNSELDTKAIEELKTKGLIVRYTVVEDGKIVQKEILVKYNSLDEVTKQMVHLKLLKKEKDVQVSKLAVLRMLMKQ